MIELMYSLLTVTGAIVLSSPIGWLILTVGNMSQAKKKNNKNKSQAKRNR